MQTIFPPNLCLLRWCPRDLSQTPALFSWGYQMFLLHKKSNSEMNVLFKHGWNNRHCVKTVLPLATKSALWSKGCSPILTIKQAPNTVFYTISFFAVMYWTLVGFSVSFGNNWLCLVLWLYDINWFSNLS